MEAISMPVVKDTNQEVRAFCRHDNAESRSEDDEKYWACATQKFLNH